MDEMTFEQFDELLVFGGAFENLDETQRVAKTGFIYDLIFMKGLWSIPEKLKQEDESEKEG